MPEEATELDLSDVYTSEEEYESEEEEETIVASLLRLKEARHTDPLSRKIWNQLDTNLRTLFGKEEQENELGGNLFVNFESGEAIQGMTMTLPPQNDKEREER